MFVVFNFDRYISVRIARPLTLLIRFFHLWLFLVFIFRWGGLWCIFLLDLHSELETQLSQVSLQFFHFVIVKSRLSSAWRYSLLDENASSWRWFVYFFLFFLISDALNYRPHLLFNFFISFLPLIFNILGFGYLPLPSTRKPHSLLFSLGS